jgi:hypothetical protein
MPSVELDVMYSLVAVFDSRLEQPFNDWEDEHVSQGFSWRPGSVSFATVESGGSISVDIVRRREALREPGDAMRAIRVPFLVQEHGGVEVSTIVGEVVVELDAGDYALTFQHGISGSGKMWAVLLFEPVEAPIEPEILQADSLVNPPPRFLMSARPA